MSSSSTTPEAGQQPEPTPAPLTPERLAEIRERAEAATPGPWGTYFDHVVYDVVADLQPNSSGYSCRRQIAELRDEPIDNDPAHRDWTAEEDATQIFHDATFITRARNDVPALLAEVERLTAEVAKYVGHEPTLTEEALYAHGEKVRAAVLEKMQRPSRLFATPAEVDMFLRRHLAEDVVLNFQQTIGGLAVEQAARELRMDANLRQLEGAHEDAAETRKLADLIDPMNSGGPYPTKLLCSQHNGFGECPGAPWCTPRQEANADGGAR